MGMTMTQKILAAHAGVDTLEAGQRVGIIRFGSRVDVYMPDYVDVAVEEGQITVAGETILANYKPKAEGKKHE